MGIETRIGFPDQPTVEALFSAPRFLPRNKQDSPFTIAEYKNMAGRAGRLGYSEIGKAIILADTPVERAQLRGGETHAHKSHFGPRLPGANRLAGC